MSTSRIGALSAALLWRGLREQGRGLLFGPLAFGLLFALVAATAIAFPAALTSVSRHALMATADGFSGVDRHAALGLATIVQEAPYLLGVFSALAGAQVAQRLVNSELARGGIELLLCAPYTVDEVLLGLLFAAFGLTAVNWLALVATTTAGALGVLLVVHADPALLGNRVYALLAFSLPLAYLAALVAVALGMLAPKLAQMRTNGPFDLLQLAATLPAIALIIAANVWPAIPSGVFAATAIAVGVVGSALAAAVVKRIFNPSTILAS
jgi:ABC-type transport system involved in multi-copper enzyme maturation permease subunit